MPCEIIAIKNLHDNYAYLITNKTQSHATVIDPGSAEPVAKALDKRNLTLTHILLTHHHYDHCGGLNELKTLYPEALTMIHMDDAGQLQRAVDRQLIEGDTIDFGQSNFKVLHLPCHTRGHVAYQIDNALFTGDTLFTAGCGKFFEGTATEMLENLKRLKTLPENTNIYCGHEYAIENLEYAIQADPTNQTIIERLQRARQKQTNGEPSVPTTLALELTSNPFLRLDDDDLQQQLKTTNELGTLIALYRIYYRETPSF